jgi:hypothetical protein
MCTDNLERIAAATQMYAFDNHLARSDVIKAKEILP